MLLIFSHGTHSFRLFGCPLLLQSSDIPQPAPRKARPPARRLAFLLVLDSAVSKKICARPVGLRVRIPLSLQKRGSAAKKGAKSTCAIRALIGNEMNLLSSENGLLIYSCLFFRLHKWPPNIIEHPDTCSTGFELPSYCGLKRISIQFQGGLTCSFGFHVSCL